MTCHTRSLQTVSSYYSYFLSAALMSLVKTSTLPQFKQYCNLVLDHYITAALLPSSSCQSSFLPHCEFSSCTVTQLVWYFSAVFKLCNNYHWPPTPWSPNPILPEQMFISLSPSPHAQTCTTSTVIPSFLYFFFFLKSLGCVSLIPFTNICRYFLPSLKIPPSP